jgi:hypothetical protein
MLHADADTHNLETLGIKACPACKGGLLERDRFCRHCGMRQPQPDPEPTQDVYMADEAGAACSTGGEVDRYRTVSGPLVNALVAAVSARTTGQLKGPILKRSFLALVLIPISLIILLLSPLDAYMAMKTLSRAI